MDQFVLKIPQLERLSDDEFFLFCAANQDLRIERNSNLDIIIMSPTGTEAGRFSTKILIKLGIWNEKSGTGEVFDSSTGFTLPDKSVLSPDASWISREKYFALTDAQRRVFAPICPEFVIEVKSPSDDIDKLHDKMKVWINNGTQLAWLIDPDAKTAWVFRANGSGNTVNGFNNKLSGENLLPGFELDLSII